MKSNNFFLFFLILHHMSLLLKMRKRRIHEYIEDGQNLHVNFAISIFSHAFSHSESYDESVHVLFCLSFFVWL